MSYIDGYVIRHRITIGHVPPIAEMVGGAHPTWLLILFSRSQSVSWNPIQRLKIGTTPTVANDQTYCVASSICFLVSL
jgi:hypothetical protein